MRKAIVSAALMGLVAFSSAWAESLPSIHDVYTVARTGHLTQARAMVDQVLAAKPDSAKGHFVKAEICARQSDTGCVRDELASAKRLDPTLSFVNPNAVKKLEAVLGTVPFQKVSAGTKSYWGWIVLGVGIVLLLGWMISAANRRAAARNAAYNANAYPGYLPAAPGTVGGMSPGYGGYGAPAQPGMGGFGSGLGRSLATGAALGAGLVAGEAIADGLIHHGQGTSDLQGSGSDVASTDNDNLGGSDFGVSDADSWGGGSDLGSSDFGGGSDW